MSQLEIKVKRELFRFESHQDWVNKAQSRYANCGVQKGFYITVDASGHVMHRGLCFKEAEKAGTFPVICYELETNWSSSDGQHYQDQAARYACASASQRYV